MNRAFLVALGALLLAPLADAHEPAGTPKHYCEPPSEWNVHDYNSDPPQLGLRVSSAGPTADPKSMPPFYDGSPGGCEYGILGNYDGHHEFGVLAYALLTADTGDGVTHGSLVCWYELSHHPSFGPISVDDVVFGGAVAFTVGADYVSLLPPTDPAQPACGDFVMDASSTCVGTCTVTFPPGIDGAYIVQVGDPATGAPATQGHVIS